MFGHKSLPSKIYSYGAKPPIEGSAIVDEQMILAHRYKNKIREVELKRRAMVNEALWGLSSELRVLDPEITEWEAKRDAADEEIRKANAAVRKKAKPEAAIVAKQAAKKALKPLYEKQKALKGSIFKSEAWKKNHQGPINEWVEAERKKIRAESGLAGGAWGTYLFAEQSMSKVNTGRPPKFKSFDGHGHLAVQIQAKRGLSITDAFSGASNFLRIDPVPDAAFERGGRRLRRTKAWFRVGSAKDRSPIWAVIPFILHRPLPADAKIKWVHLIRWPLGKRFEWRIQFVLSKAIGWAREDAATEGCVGIDVGWRMKEDGSLRVAYWGTENGHGELALSAGWLGQMKKVRELRSTQDVIFEDARDGLVAWLKEAQEVPDWMKEASQNLPLWKSKVRLAVLVLHWRDNRFARDEIRFKALEAWRRRDKRLYEYESNLRDQMQGQRTHLFREFAAAMRRKYKTAIIEDLDFRKFHKVAEAEEDSIDGALKEHVRDACLSVFVQCIEESMTETLRVPAQNTTRIHVSCGSIEDWDRKELMHTCSKCGETYDQDWNAAMNLLHAASAQVV